MQTPTVKKQCREPLRRRASASRLLAVLGLGMSCFGCMAHSKYMQEMPAPVPALAPTASAARVVFVRPSGMAGAIKFMIIDQNGRFIGESTANSHFAVDVPPGEYLFIAEGENTAVMHANVAANHLYYVEVTAKMGILIARVALEPIKPGSEAWNELQQSLAETQRLTPLAQAGQAALAAKSKAIVDRIANAKSKWADYSAQDRAELSLEPSDGVAGPEAPQNVAAALPAPTAPAPGPAPSQPTTPALPATSAPPAPASSPPAAAGPPGS